MAPLSALLLTALSLLLGTYYSRIRPFSAPADGDDKWSCKPFLPKVFIETPPDASHGPILLAMKELDDYFSKRFSQGDFDSISMAVVTSKGVLFEKSWGVIRGNESSTSPATTSHASYRLASVSKLFAVLEGFLLEQKGILSWHDPVDKYLPNFKYRLDGFAPTAPAYDKNEAPITLFQLATHMSGLGRDWPPGTSSGWPDELDGNGAPPMNGLPFPSHEALYKAIEEHRLVSPPFAYPSYSNTGMGLLGLALVAANRAASNDPSHEPATYADLVSRDIFTPLGLDGSHFLATDTNKANIVVPSIAPEFADMDFLDAMNAAGGQFASLSDFVKLLPMLLNPAQPGSLITRYSMNKWLQTVHDFDEDQWTAMGVMWEILKHQDSYGRLHKIFWKLGSVAAYNSAIAIHPASSYGIVVLIAGEYHDAGKLAYDALDIIQPAMDKTHTELVSRLYAGRWSSDDGQSIAVITVEKGTLYVDGLKLNDSTVHMLYGAPSKMPLRPVPERRDEFRLDIGMPEFNGQKHIACYTYWNGQDIWGMRHSAPTNLLYFSDSENARYLHFPAAGVRMKRT